MPRLLVALLVAFTATLTAQAPSASISIEGIAVSTEGVPLRRARVAIVGSSRFEAVGPMVPVFTSGDGHFAAAVAPADSYTITVTKAGYAIGTMVVRPAGSPLYAELRLQRAAAISGRVTDETGTPAVEQQVTATRLDTQGPDPAVPASSIAARLLELTRTQFGVTTDDRGEFRVSGLPAGRYEVRPGSAGAASVIVRSSSDSKVPSRVPEPAILLTLGAGQEATADLLLNRRVVPSGVTRRVYSVGGAIRVAAPTSPADRRAVEGMLIDEFGEPLQGARVDVLLVRRQAGRYVAGRLGPSRMTDDRGYYRIFGLPPGRYLVMATAGADVSQNSALGYAPVYYPGTPQIELAGAVSLETGDAAGVSFTVAPSTSARITGIALDSAGRGLSFPSVRLISAGGTRGIVLESMHAAVNSRREFVFRDVPPGEYVVQATGERLLGRSREFGIARVTVVDRDPPPVIVQTSPGIRLEGRFVVDGAEPLPALAAAAVPLDPDRIPIGTPERPLVVTSTGDFYGTTLSGPTGIALRRAPEDWFIKSIAIAGADVTDGGFDFGTSIGTIEGAEIVVSPRGASISGRLSDAGADVRSVVVFPRLRNGWTRHSRHMKAAAVGADGSFHVRGLPPGEYWVAPLAGVNPAIDEWHSPEVLDPLVAGAIAITLAEDESRRVDID